MKSMWKLSTLLSVALLSMSGCANEDRTTCDRGTLVNYGTADYCVVIEEGFLTSDCPEDFPEGVDFGDAVVCGEEAAPEEIREVLEEAGLIEAGSCEDDAPEGVEYVAIGDDCQVVDYSCPEDAEAYADDCGCGCRQVEQTECTEGDTKEIDCNGCTCQDGEWLCTTAACECSEGETRMEDCNECVCDAGTWSCTEMECGDCTEGETSTDGCESCWCSEGQWLCEADLFCEYEACVEACPASCDAPEDQVCGDDLQYHCTECHMACADVTEVDRSQCEDPASTCGPPPPTAVPLEWEAFTPDGCGEVPFGTFEEAVIFTSESEFQAGHDCTTAATGMNWETNRMARWLVGERTEAELLGVYANDGSVLGHTAAPAYCGGAAPPSVFVYAIIPLDGPTSIAQTDCTYGECSGPPVP